MQTVIKKLSELRRPDKNVRRHSDKQIKEYMRSIEMFGQLRPMVIDEDNIVLAGNGLLTALMHLERETADCYVVTGLTSNQKKKLMLADNKIYELGVNDVSAFDELLRDLSGDIDIPGYDEDLLRALTVSAAESDKMIKSYAAPDKEPTARTNHEQTQHQPPQDRPSTPKISAVATDEDFNCSCPRCGFKFNR